MTQALTAAEIDPTKDPRTLGKDVPSAENVESMPRLIRQDADRIAEWTKTHLENSLAQRESLERSWINVVSYMAGHHYFRIDSNTGSWRPIPKKADEVRAVVPLMRSRFRREIGRLTENILTVQAMPRGLANPYAFFKAHRAEAMINSWLEETEFEQTYEEWCTQLCYYGLSGLYRYVDPIEEQVHCEAWPASDLHPIPWDATNDHELQGIMRVKLKTREWIEQFIGMKAAEKAGKATIRGPRVALPSLGSIMGTPFGGGREQDVATVIWVWLLPTVEIPSGQHYVLVEDEMFQYRTVDENGRPIALRNGKIPIELCRYSRQHGSWYGMGFCAPLVGQQREADRQMSKVVRSARLNNGMLFYNDEILNTTDLFNDDQQMIGFDSSAYGSQDPFYHFIPPVPQNRDVGATLQIAQELANQAAGHESEIIFGRAEGRVESGPLGRILNVNAQAPLAPTFRNIRVKLLSTYYEVLNLITEVWPDNKRISTVGRYELPSEMLVGKDNRPVAEDVILHLAPLLPAGRTEMANFLFQMRQIKGDQGKPELSAEEFRRGLAAIGMAPPGIELFSRKDQRIRQRVAQLFGDGKKPGMLVRSELDFALLKLEDPRAFRDALVEKILDPAFMVTASNEVKSAFLQMLKQLVELIIGDRFKGDGSDDVVDTDAHDAMKMEEFADAAEQRPDIAEGKLVMDNMPVGAV